MIFVTLVPLVATCRLLHAVLVLAFVAWFAVLITVAFGRLVTLVVVVSALKVAAAGVLCIALVLFVATFWLLLHTFPVLAKVAITTVMIILALGRLVTLVVVSAL